MSPLLRIGTRKSPLALWQAEHVRDRLLEAHPGLEVELVKVETRGDKILDVPLARVGGKALFVKEIEDMLLQGEVDIAVHSMKDVPTVLPPGLGLVATSSREDPLDAFVARDPAATPGFDDLPLGARVGTSSLRRAAQLLAARPDLEIVSIRGNVGTRLGKLEADNLDAVILACAGLERLGEGDRITARLDPLRCLPAIGQGALGIEARLDDDRVGALVACLNDPETAACVAAERGLLAGLEGGCQVPIAGYAVLRAGQVALKGRVATLDGATLLERELVGPPDAAEALGRELAEQLLQDGAREILSEIYAAAEADEAAAQGIP